MKPSLAGDAAVVFESIDQAFGDLVRRQRCALGLSQAELAHHLGLTVQQVQDIERGVQRAPASLVARIARLAADGVLPPRHARDRFHDETGAVPVMTGLVDDFTAIHSPRLRRALLSLLHEDGGGPRPGVPPLAAGDAREMRHWV